MRPAKFHNTLKQQSRDDLKKTREIGNTRIIILEQVNHQGKSEFRVWNRKFPLIMKDSISQLMRVGFTFASFKPAFIIGHSTSI